MRLSLVPRTGEFYDLFTRAGANARDAAQQAARRFREYPDTSVRQSDIKELEHEGDRLTHEIVQLLNTQYVTPFDREDIYSVATAVDDVVDNIEEASDLLSIYKVESSMEQALQQCDVLVGAVDNLATALSTLRGMRDTSRFVQEVKRYEDEGDRIVRDAMAALFEDEAVDPRVIIQWKDIFEALEQAIDACETAAHYVGNVVVKNA